MPPLISVIIPCYSSERVLSRTVQSVLDQTLQDFEILIIDDCSPDTSFSIAKTIEKKESRVRAFKTEHNSGPSVARNIGIEAAQGKWVAILDADDVYLPNRLERLVSIAEKLNLDVIADNLLLFDAWAQKIQGKALKIDTDMHVDLDFFLENDFSGEGYSFSIVHPMVKKSFLTNNNIKYPPHYRHGEDSYFCTLLLIHHARFYITSECHYVYTVSVGAISKKPSGLSHTRVDFFRKAESCTEILNEYGSLIKAKSRQLILQRVRRNLFLYGFNLLKSGHLASFVIYSLKHPIILIGMPTLWVQRRTREIYCIIRSTIHAFKAR